MKRCFKIKYLFDLHSDIPSALYNDLKSSVSYPKELCRQVQTAALFIGEDKSNPYTFYRNMLTDFLSVLKLPVNCLEAEKTVILSLEGGAAFEKDFNRLYSIKADGISSVSLTWNADNTLAGGALGIGSLTKRGRNALKLLNELSLALDISHLNEKSASAATVLADTVLASHSNSFEIHPHPRNLKREILLDIGAKGGIVGINFYPFFLPEGDVFEGIYKNIEYMLSLGLENSVAIGSDFDGAEMDKSLQSTEDIFALYGFLEERIGDKELLFKIFFKNAYAFYKKLFDKRDIVV